jgi:uncharacterized protein
MRQRLNRATALRSLNLWRSLLLVVASAVSMSGISAAKEPEAAPDTAPWLNADSVRSETYSDVDKTSQYVKMPDGVRLAIDIYLPKGMPANAQLPTIIQQTRYYRAAASGSDPMASCRAIWPSVAYYVKRGYAYVIVDVRGSGASFGTRRTELASEEIKDGAAIVDWIIGQPWSSGKVGATGGSYVGTSAELLLLNHHKAVKAVAPLSVGYDFYGDVAYPGGAENTPFNRGWGEFIAELDREPVPGKPREREPCPVDADTDGSLLRAAAKEHLQNADMSDTFTSVRFRDDQTPGWPEGWPSPYRYRAKLDSANTPLLSIVGWADAGYAKAGIHRFINTRSKLQRLVIPSGNHGVAYYYAPHINAPTLSSFDYKAEILRFFDHYVAGIDNGYEKEPPLRWYTTGSNTWQSARSFPIPKTKTDYCLALQRVLKICERSKSVIEEFVPARDAETGKMSRWNTSLGAGPVFYADRRAIDEGLPTYTSAPLASPVAFTGAPELVLKISNTVPDSDYFVYLEDVDPTGRVGYVTEGLIRASHSKSGKAPYRTLGPGYSDLRKDRLRDLSNKVMDLHIALLPASHMFKPGHSIRISLAASDREHFTSAPVAGQKWSIHLGGVRPSRLMLPQVK